MRAALLVVVKASKSEVSEVRVVHHFPQPLGGCGGRTGGGRGERIPTRVEEAEARSVF